MANAEEINEGDLVVFDYPDMPARHGQTFRVRHIFTYPSLGVRYWLTLPDGGDFKVTQVRCEHLTKVSEDTRLA